MTLTDRIEGPFVTGISSEKLAHNFVASLILAKGNLLKIEQSALLMIQELRNESHSDEVKAALTLPRRWQHIKSGGRYQEVCRAKVQASIRPIIEDDLIVVYTPLGGKGEQYWARDVNEFEDGRFARLTD